MLDAKLRPCGCSVPGCDLMVCVVCGVSDCKWPGECKGKCTWCGGYNARAFPEDSRNPPSSTCSNECCDKLWAHYESLGQVVSLSDLTPEQINAEFAKVGLALEGVGERQPS